MLYELKDRPVVEAVEELFAAVHERGVSFLETSIMDLFNKPDSTSVIPRIARIVHPVFDYLVRKGVFNPLNLWYDLIRGEDDLSDWCHPLSFCAIQPPEHHYDLVMEVDNNLVVISDIDKFLIPLKKLKYEIPPVFDDLNGYCLTFANMGVEEVDLLPLWHYVEANPRIRCVDLRGNDLKEVDVSESYFLNIVLFYDDGVNIVTQ